MKTKTKKVPKNHQVSGSYEGLLNHLGHKLECVYYGELPYPANVAIECIDCGCVVVDFERDKP